MDSTEKLIVTCDVVARIFGVTIMFAGGYLLGFLVMSALVWASGVIR